MYQSFEVPQLSIDLFFYKEIRLEFERYEYAPYASSEFLPKHAGKAFVLAIIVYIIKM